MAVCLVCLVITGVEASGVGFLAGPLSGSCSDSFQVPDSVGFGVELDGFLADTEGDGVDVSPLYSVTEGATVGEGTVGWVTSSGLVGWVVVAAITKNKYAEFIEK